MTSPRLRPLRAHEEETCAWPWCRDGWLHIDRKDRHKGNLRSVVRCPVCARNERDRQAAAAYLRGQKRLERLLCGALVAAGLALAWGVYWLLSFQPQTTLNP